MVAAAFIPQTIEVVYDPALKNSVWANALNLVVHNRYVPITPTPKQALFLGLPYREAMFGGAAGPGKSIALLAHAAKWVHYGHYRALILRRSFTDLSQAGALMDVADQWWGRMPGVKWRARTNTWLFPSGAQIRFGYMKHENDKYQYAGSEYHCVVFDELTQFSETQYRFMFSRNRKDRDDPIPLTIRSASNPPLGGNADPGWWVKRQLYDKGWPTFVPAALSDNPYIDRAQYVESLMFLDPISRERLLAGNWEIKAAGTMFSTDKIEIVSQMPPMRASVRFWDLASTEPTIGNPNPDATAGARVGIGLDGNLYIMHIARLQANPDKVERAVRQHAMMDTINVQVWIEQEPGAAGKALIDYYKTKVLPTFMLSGANASGSKVVKATPFANKVGQGQVKMMAGPWNSVFLEELEAFPLGEHDDQVDAVSGAINHLDLAGTIGPVSPDMARAALGRI
jgi:predicted phage terminase large subunit-like protein